MTTTDDELTTNGKCSLREAIRAANMNRRIDSCAAGSSTSTDTISVPAGTYVLGLVGANEDDAKTGDLDIRSAVRLTGAGTSKTIIDGTRADCVLQVHSGATLTAATLTVQNGYNSYGTGGGFENAGSLTLNQVVVRNNDAEIAGGGIASIGAQLKIDDSTIANNAGYKLGGGIFVDAPSTAAIYRTTITGNIAEEGGGGGIEVWAGASVTLTNSTISANIVHSWSDTPYYVGGLDSSGSLTLLNSTVTGN